MSEAKERRAAVPGWLTLDAAAPCLLGTRCRACGTTFFPKESHACRNPRCGAGELEEVALSRRGKLWSWTDNRYAPPPPYPAREPFEPYAIAAVELAEEKMVVLGQVERGVAAGELRAGMEMELGLATLCEDEKSETLTWCWRPVRAG